MLLLRKTAYRICAAVEVVCGVLIFILLVMGEPGSSSWGSSLTYLLGFGMLAGLAEFSRKKLNLVYDNKLGLREKLPEVKRPHRGYLSREAQAELGAFDDPSGGAPR
jgi:hypothetical protein